MARTICFLSLLLMPLLCTAYVTNDGSVITLSFTLSSYQVVEANGPAQPVLRLSRPVDCCSTISVWVYVEEIEARQGTNKEIHDYISKSHIQVLFPGGVTTAKFDVHMVDNVILENTERFRVYIDPLSLPYGVAPGDITSAEVNIVDDDETEVSLDKSTHDASEGDGSVDLTLQLTKPIPFINSTLQLVIDDSNDHTAKTCDYGSRMHTVPIPIDKTSFIYKLPITDDDLFEIDETFKVQIVDTSLHSKIKRTQPYATTVTVTDDEEPISVTLTTPPTIDEDAGDLKVTLSLGRPSPCCLRVYVETIDIDEMAVGEGVDYGAEGDGRLHEVIFPAGASCSSFEIPINDDGVSEKDEAFTIKILEESLPYGVTLGGNTKTDVMIIDNDIYLRFNSSTYEDYERERELCVTVTLDKPAFFDTFVQILETRGTATSGRDYEEGPYNVTIPRGNMSATYCIDITNDEELEMDEAFRITINENALDQNVIAMSPNEARVIILDDEYTFCFEQRSYAVKEDVGYLSMKISLSRVLPFNISVKFLYADRNANGNHSGGNEEDIDYYTTKTFPDFDIIPPYERDYILNVTIVADRVLEDNELFHVTAVPQHVPAGQPECSVDVIIRDDDDITLEFEKDSYIVNKNEDVQAVILITYPASYAGNGEMRVHIRVDEIDDTTTVEDYTRMNYTFDNVTKETTRIPLLLNSIDDNIVEADEVYNLTIVVLPTSHLRVITNEAKETTKIIIRNDDVSFLSYEMKSLTATKSMEFPANTTATVNINYKDDQNNTTTVTITPDQAIVWSFKPITLPVLDLDVENIVVDFPCKFHSTLKSGGSNVRPSDLSMVPITVTYNRCD